MKLSKRQLAARFVDALESTPLNQLAEATVGFAVAAGYDRDDLADLIATVEQELQEGFGSGEVKLTTAHALPTAALDALAAKVAAAAGLRHFSYRHTVNAELVGGFEAQAGDLWFHNSIRERLAHLETSRG